MAKKIKMEMTVPQYEALLEMVSENAIWIGGADEEYSKATKKRVVLVNRMLKNNNMNAKINY